MYQAPTWNGKLGRVDKKSVLLETKNKKVLSTSVKRFSHQNC